MLIAHQFECLYSFFLFVYHIITIINIILIINLLLILLIISIIINIITTIIRYELLIFFCLRAFFSCSVLFLSPLVFQMTENDLSNTLSFVALFVFSVLLLLLHPAVRLPVSLSLFLFHLRPAIILVITISIIIHCFRSLINVYSILIIRNIIIIFFC